MNRYKCGNERPCKTLSDRLEVSGHSGKGFQAVEVVNFRTGQTQIIGIQYKTHYKDRGIMLNYCPWCGKNILWIDNQNSKDSTDNRRECGHD